MNKMRTYVIAGVLTAVAAGVCADTSLTAYGTYWDGDDTGKGAGLRLKKTILAFAAVEGRGGYVEFEDTNTEIVPVDVSINVRFPFVVSPYAGIGAEYCFLNTDQPNADDFSGYFAQVGVEATFLWFGAMAELRYHDTEEDYFDGTSANVGLLLKW